MERITVKQAASRLSTTPLTVRVAMEQGALPIGMVIRHGKRNAYIVYRELLDGFLKEKT